VNVRNTRGGMEKCVPGTVIRRLEPLTYLVRVGRQLRYVHIDHLLQTERVNCEEAFEVLPFQRQPKTNLLRLGNLLLNQFLSPQLQTLQQLKSQLLCPQSNFLLQLRSLNYHLQCSTKVRSVQGTRL